MDFTRTRTPDQPYPLKMYRFYATSSSQEMSAGAAKKEGIARRTREELGPAIAINIILASRTRKLTHAEEDLFKLLRFATSRFGAPLLGASTPEDFEDRLDQVLEDPIFFMANALIFALLNKDREILSEVEAEAAKEDGSGAEEVFTTESARQRFAEAIRYAAASAEAGLKAIKREPAEKVQADLRSLVLEPRPLPFITDPTVHPTAARALLAALKAGACLFAVCEAMLTNHRMAAWLEETIATCSLVGQREYLRLIASLPNSGVSEELVPRSERFDADQLTKDAEETHRRFEAELLKSEQSGQSVYPPITDGNDS